MNAVDQRAPTNTEYTRRQFCCGAWGYLPHPLASVVLDSLRHTREAVQQYLDAAQDDTLETADPLPGEIVQLEIYRVLH